MAFNPNSGANEWRKRVTFSGDAVTVRYADTDLAMSNGNFFAGRVLGISELRRSVGRLLDPKIQYPQMRVQLDNRNDDVRETFDQYNLENRTVTIDIGQGTTEADYDELFTGVTKLSGGDWTDDYFNVRISDLVEADARVLPPNKFFPSTYSNVEVKSKFLPIPIVYGDWRTTAGDGETVPCYCIDTTIKKFKIADHALKEIEVVYLNGNDITSDCTLDASNGEFTILSTTYDPDTDTVTANVQGATDDGTPSGNLLKTLPEILDDILQKWLEVSASKIDSTALTTWANNLSSDDEGRRVIKTELSSNSIISDLLVDGFADLTIISGKYTPVYRIVSVDSDIDTYREDDIESNGGSREFRVVRDEEQVYANQIVADYRITPTNGDFTQRYDAEDSAAIASANIRKRRRITLNWVYKDAGAQARADRELYVFSSPIETVFLTLKTRAITKAPTNQFRLIYSKYELAANIGTPFQIREISTDPLKLTARIKAWSMLQLSPGRWTPNGAPTWLLSTAWQRETNGHWTDTNGYADPTGTPDEASKRSIWI